jgi:hypothetical protein
MRFIGVLSLSCCLLTSVHASAAAQAVSQAGSTHSSVVTEIRALSPEQERDLATWIAAMEKWQEYDAKWQNRPVHDGWGGFSKRKPPPTAPPWLAGRCGELRDASVLDLDAQAATACRLMDDARAAVAPPVTTPDAEKPPRHSSFLNRVHLDALATSSENGARMYGLIGSHVSLVDVGPVQLFGPPGVLMVSVPDGRGGRRVTLGYTWGVSVRLADTSLGGREKNVTIFLNISKVWLGSSQNAPEGTRGYNIVGLSIAPRKTR